MDSFYSSPEVLQWIEEKNILYLTSLHKSWWSRPWNAVLSSLVENGDSSSLASPLNVIDGVKTDVCADDGPLGDENDQKCEDGDTEKEDAESEIIEKAKKEKC
jgi:hypothetical protein